MFIDYLYYLRTQVVKPIDELLKLCLGINKFMEKQFEFRVNKTNLLASFSLASPSCTGLISPLKPTSPKETKFFGIGLFFRLDKTANNTGRSIPGSVIFTPPTMFTKIS